MGGDNTADRPTAYAGPYPILTHRSIAEHDREQFWRRCMLRQAVELFAPVASHGAEISNTLARPQTIAAAGCAASDLKPFHEVPCA